MPKSDGFKNLQPTNTLSKDEVRKRGSNGGKKSGEVRAQKKLFKEIFESLIQIDISKTNCDDEALEALRMINPELADKADIKTIISSRVIDKAMKGDMYAIGFLRDSLGESPTIKQEVVNTNLNIESNIDKAKELKKLLDKNG